MRRGPSRASKLNRMVLFGLFVGFSAPGLSAQDTRALSLMEEAGARYSDLRGFCARFQQVLAVPLLGDTTRASGSLCQEAPNLFAMRFAEPEGDLLVADGEAFWVYYPSSDPRQVLRFELESRPGGLDFQREFLESPGEKYTMAYLGTEALPGGSTHVLSLVPKGPAGFEGAKIWLDPDRFLIVRARIEMENGSVRTVSLSEIELNPSPDPSRFRFVPPEGAQVIRRR
ncbi:MAG: outer membrane lipoprotein carrier protein LolA [Gemmatimonadetes bacterium]|nr:outer membrane lipoprotein carrier protein LolA [Gemmatimonadota bacterium]NNM05221.1 outer membrane lipoprotein carrier protein LolA [Gemmatimonadota bacterium]